MSSGSFYLFLPLFHFLLFGQVAFSSLKVLAPDELKESLENGGTLEYSLGDFGHLPYGDTLNGILVLPEKQNENSQDDVMTGCQGIKPINPVNYPGYALFLVFKRGGCTFARKGLNAQAAGASAVILIDKLEENVADVHMVDDHECISSL